MQAYKQLQLTAPMNGQVASKGVGLGKGLALPITPVASSSIAATADLHDPKKMYFEILVDHNYGTQL